MRLPLWKRLAAFALAASLLPLDGAARLAAAAVEKGPAGGGLPVRLPELAAPLGQSLIPGIPGSAAPGLPEAAPPALPAAPALAVPGAGPALPPAALEALPPRIPAAPGVLRPSPAAHKPALEGPAAVLGPQAPASPAPQDPLAALRQTVSNIEAGNDNREEIDRLFGVETLRLPSGSDLRVETAHNEAARDRGAMGRSGLPEGGLLIQWHQTDVPIALWRKNTLAPMDIVTLDSSGRISEVVAEAPPSYPGTPWRAVGLHESRGMYSLLLPAGQAKREGLAAGQLIEGLRPVPLRIESERLALWVLEGGERGLGTAWRYFKENPGAFADFDAMAGLIEERIARARTGLQEEKALAYQEAKARLYRTVIADPEASSMYASALSRHDFGLWFKNLSSKQRLRQLVNIPFRYPAHFVHELGHYAAARLLGLKPTAFRVFPGGGGYVMADGEERLGPRRLVLFDLAGVAAQALAGLLLAAAGWTVLARQGGHWQLPRHPGALALAAAEVLTSLGHYFLWYAVPGGAYDFAGAAQNLGKTRLGKELAWRRGLPRYKGSLGFYRLLADLLRESARPAPSFTAEGAFQGRVLAELSRTLPRITGRGDDGFLAARLARRIRPRRFSTVFKSIYLDGLPYALFGVALTFSATFPLLVCLPLAALIWAWSALPSVPAVMKGEPDSEAAARAGMSPFVFVPPDAEPAEFSAAVARGLPRLLARASRVESPAAVAFKVLRLAELSQGEGLAARMSGGEAGRFIAGVQAMRARLEGGSEAKDLDSFEKSYRARARNAVGGFRRLLWGSLDAEAGQYGEFLAGLAFEFAARSGRPDDAWAFLRLVARGATPERAFDVLREPAP